MLKFVKTDTFRATVNVSLATDTPGKTNDGSFIATFKHYDRTGFEALVEEQLPDDEFLSRVMPGVSGISDADGTPYPPDEQRAIVIGDMAMSAAAVRTFVEQLAGAGAKNAKTSRGR